MPDVKSFLQKPRIMVNNEVEKGIVEFEYWWGNCHFRPDGSLFFYHYSYEGRPKAPLGTPLSRVQSEALLKRYYRAAGYSDEIHLREVQPTEDAGGEPELLLEGVRMWNDVPFAASSGVSAYVQRVSGKLRALRIGARIPPPNHGADERVMSRAEAIDAMMVALFASTDVPEAQLLKEPELVVGVAPGGEDARFDHRRPESRVAAARLQGRLIYQATVFDRSSWSEELQSYTQGYDMYVDARTGQALSAFFGSAGGRVDPRPSKPKPLVIGPATMRLRTDRIASTVRGARITSSDAPKGTPMGLKLILNVGKVWRPVYFDPKSALLWTEQGANRLYGKPNKPLLDALQKLAKRQS